MWGIWYRRKGASPSSSVQMQSVRSLSAGQHTHADDAAVEAMVAMEPIGRLGRAEGIAGGVIWLCSDKASFVTGSTLAIDGGFMAGRRLHM